MEKTDKKEKTERHDISDPGILKVRRINYMNNTLSIITNKLVSAGMEKKEAEMLIAKFLEEEVFDYVSCVVEQTKQLIKEESSFSA